jgi:RimJ/RimL family protein N-acetyltransferase
MGAEGTPPSPGAPGARAEPATAADLPILSGRRVLLRQPLPEDVAVRLEVPADPEAHRMYGGSGAPAPHTAAGLARELAAAAGQDVSQSRRFVVAARAWPDGRPVAGPAGRNIGGIRLHSINRTDRRARLAVGLFDRRFWSHGYGSEAVRLLLGYAFDTMGLHRVDLRVLAYNVRAIRAYDKCGFVREGVERESALVDGRWYDDVLMAILEGEYRALS